jgi:hypothetical protein
LKSSEQTSRFDGTVFFVVLQLIRAGSAGCEHPSHFDSREHSSHGTHNTIFQSSDGYACNHTASYLMDGPLLPSFRKCRRSLISALSHASVDFVTLNKKKKRKKKEKKKKIQKNKTTKKREKIKHKKSAEGR